MEKKYAEDMWNVVVVGEKKGSIEVMSSVIRVGMYSGGLVWVLVSLGRSWS